MCIRSGTKAKAVLTILSILMFPYSSTGAGFSSDSGLIPHLAYPFIHANVWHMACNLFVLWGIRNRLDTIPAYIIAVAMSWMPMWVDKPTTGMSGLLFAMFGIMWGRTGMAWKCVKTGLPVILTMMLIPNVNGMLHLYCYAAGFTVGFLCEKYIRKL